MAVRSIYVKRFKNELIDVAKCECGISIEVLNNNLEDLKGKISGPPDTPYEGGEFILDIKIPPGYPFKSPTATFVTKIWHPNIDSWSGKLCTSDMKRFWTPSMTLRTFLLSIQALLQDPALDDPLNFIAVAQCQRNPEMYKLTAKYFAQVFAGAPRSNLDFDDKIEKLKDTGANERQAVFALSECSWNLERAVRIFLAAEYLHKI